jgi:hypothetical protein
VNMWTAIVALTCWVSMSRTSATVGGVHVPLLWLLAAGMVLALFGGVLLLIRLVAQDGGWRLTPAPVGAA